MGDSLEGVQSSAAESEEGRKKVACISTAQVLGLWEQRLAATVRRRLPMASQGSPGNASRLFTTIVRKEKEKDWNNSGDLSLSMQEVIKGLLGQDKWVWRFRAVYNLPKKERQKLAKQKGREAYYAKNWAQDRVGIMTFKRCIYVPTGGGLRSEIIRTNHHLPWVGPFGIRRTLDLVSRKYYWLGMRRDVI